MSDVIKLLPDSVANQIAAGEVIQRPASVVKELVENAIDAQANDVQIVLKDAGRTLIQIVDNGIGMSETDARLAFERHSTSKIRVAEDLFQLHTMGFRGEALASIAAIAQVELRTRRTQDELGTKLIINASRCEQQECVACPVGANFMIKNLFFNVPARRRFLKSNPVELSNIIKEFERLALVNHNVAFTLTHNGTILYKLPATTFLQRIAALFGNGIEQQLVPLNVSTSIVKITGFVAKPEHARKRNYLQYFFVNGRYMRHPYFHKAVLTCYNQLIPDDKQPNYFLQFTVEPQAIDVNIHPTKTEIKFQDELPIWQILSAAVRESLGRFSEVPVIDFNQAGTVDIPPYDPNGNPDAPQVDVDKSYNPFRQQAEHARRQVTSDWEQLFQSFQNNTPTEKLGVRSEELGVSQEGLKKINSASSASSARDDLRENNEIFPASEQVKYLQLKGRYILSPVKSGLMLIDQHRAHLRTLYDRYMTRLQTAPLPSQTLLFPEKITLLPAQAAIIRSLLDDLHQLGFSIHELGVRSEELGVNPAQNSQKNKNIVSGESAEVCGSLREEKELLTPNSSLLTITAVPAGLEGVNIHQLILQVIETVENGGEDIRRNILRHIALCVAGAAAIPYNRPLLPEEMEIIVADLLKLPQPNYTPDGKNIIAIIPIEQIAKLF